MKHKNFFVFCAVVLFSISSVSAENKNDRDEIISVFTDYLEAYSSSDFFKAASFVHPQHLSDYREYTLPVLIDAKNDPRSSKHPIVEVFFEKVSDDNVYDLTGTQVSAYLDRAWTTYLPSIIESARLKNIKIKSVNSSSMNSATIKYDYRLSSGDIQSLEEKFSKHEGSWHILLPIPPKKAAIELRSLFKGG